MREPERRVRIVKPDVPRSTLIPNEHAPNFGLRPLRSERTSSVRPGFTHEMVHSIRLIAEAVEGIAHQNHVARMRAAADCIEALLPPRKT